MNDLLRLRSSIPGRSRWEVYGIQRRPQVAANLAALLSRKQPFTRATANPKTGRVLVFYPASLNIAEVQRLLLSTVDELGGNETSSHISGEDPDSDAGHDHDHCDGHDHDHHHGDPASLRRNLWTGGLTLSGLAIKRLISGPGFLVNSPLLVAAVGVTTLYTGWSYINGTVRSLTGQTRMSTDTLVGTATIAGVVTGEGVTSLTVIWLLNLGEYLQTVVLRRTRIAIRELLDIDDEAWLLLPGGAEKLVSLTEVQSGAIVVVRAGLKIPVDGIVVDGSATVNEAPITGESVPVIRTKGDRVFCATLLLAGELYIKAEQVGSDTAGRRLIERVEEAQALKPAIQTVGNRFAERLVPASFLLSGVVFAVTGHAHRALTMLLIACPCAIGLSTPTAISAAIGVGARRGLLVKGGTHMEVAAGLDTLIFDKTGTLTQGQPAVSTIVVATDAYTEPHILKLAAACELPCQHPLALAVVNRARERGIELQVAEHYEVMSGGVAGVVVGEKVLVGNEGLMAEHGLSVPQNLDQLRNDRVELGESIVFVSHADRIVGMLTICEQIRLEARAVINELRELGIERVVILTGDNEQAVAQIASQAGIDEWHSGQLPEDKYEYVRRLRDMGHKVGMVGDGINDAPALALADVGFAMGTGGSDIAIETADIALAGDDLSAIPDVIRLSRSAISTIRENYALAIGVNAGGLAVAAIGGLSPFMAALLHNLGTLAVVANSSRLLEKSN